MWNSDGAYWHIPYSSSCSSSSSSSFFFFFCDRVSKKEGAGGHTVQASPARHQGNYWGPVLRDSVWGGGLAGRGRGLEAAGARVLPQGDDQGQSREPSYPAQCCVLVYSTECISWCYTLYLHVGTPRKCRQLPNTQACCVIVWSEPFLLPCIFVHAPDWQSFIGVPLKTAEWAAKLCRARCHVGLRPKTPHFHVVALCSYEGIAWDSKCCFLFHMHLPSLSFSLLPCWRHES